MRFRCHAVSSSSGFPFLTNLARVVDIIRRKSDPVQMRNIGRRNRHDIIVRFMNRQTDVYGRTNNIRILYLSLLMICDYNNVVEF